MSKTSYYNPKEKEQSAEKGNSTGYPQQRGAGVIYADFSRLFQVIRHNAHQPVFRIFDNIKPEAVLCIGPVALIPYERYIIVSGIRRGGKKKGLIYSGAGSGFT